jgi:hypothetical protein
MKSKILLFLFFFGSALSIYSQQKQPDYKTPQLPVERRVEL